MAQTTCGYDLMRYWSRRMIPEDEGVLLAHYMRMIHDYKSSTRYKRREETKNVLEFIHGGFEASLYGHGIFWLPMQVMKTWAY